MIFLENASYEILTSKLDKEIENGKISFEKSVEILTDVDVNFSRDGNKEENKRIKENHLYVENLLKN